MRAMMFTMAVAAAALAFACSDDGNGGGDPLALDEYLGTVERLNAESETRTDAASAPLQDLTSATSEEELKAAFSGAYEQFLEIVDDTLAELKQIDPPADAEDAHGEFVAGFETLQEAFGDARQAISDATTREDLATVIDELGESATLEEASDRLQRACVALQRLADDNSIDINLGCEAG